jgi:hypothetical protein
VEVIPRQINIFGFNEGQSQYLHSCEEIEARSNREKKEGTKEEDKRNERRGEKRREES